MRLRERALTWAAIALLLAAMVLGVIDYRRAAEGMILDGAHLLLKSVVSEHADTVSAQIEGELAWMRAVAEEGQGPDAPVVALPGGSRLETAGYADASGRGQFGNGKDIDLAAWSVMDGMQERGICVIGAINEGARAAVLLAAPVMDGAATTGYVVGYFSSDAVQRMLSLAAPGISGDYFVTDRSGRVLAYAERMGQLSIVDNALEFFGDSVYVSGDAIGELAGKMAEGATGSFAYNYGNQDRYTAYAPLGGGKGYLFGVVASDHMEAQFGNLRTRTPRLIVYLTLCSFMLFGVLWWDGKRHLKALKASQRALRQSEVLLDVTRELSYTIMFEVHPQTGALHVNDAFERQLGRKLVITNLFDVSESGAPPEDIVVWIKIADEIQRGVSKATSSVRLRHQNGALLWYRLSYESLYQNGDKEPFIITGRIANIERQDHEGDGMDVRAGSDPLTGLLGHRAFMEQCERMIVDMHRGALLFVDIDGFKEARDPKGRYDGEQLIVHLADKLRRLFAPGDLIGRLGGDTFAVLIADTGKESITNCSKVLIDAFDDFELPLGSVRPTCSVGIAQVDSETKNLDELSRRADNALYRAKLAGKHRFEYYEARPTADNGAPGAPGTPGARGRASDSTSVMLRCTTALLTEPLPAAMDVVLRETASYYHAERAYVLQLDEAGKTIRERYTWHSPGAQPHENDMSFALDDVPLLMGALDAHKPVVIAEAIGSEGLDANIRETLLAEGIRSVYLMPLSREGKRVGFIGLDNPSDHMGNASLLKSLAQCVFAQLVKRRQEAAKTKKG